MLEPVLLSDVLSSLPVPLIGRLISAGFPSPADDYLEGEIDPSAFLIDRPAATYIIKVSGESMKGAGIMHGDFLIVDKSIEPRSGHIVVVNCNGEFMVKRLQYLSRTRAVLKAENPDFPLFEVCEENPAEIWGVVTGSFRKNVF